MHKRSGFLLLELILALALLSMVVTLGIGSFAFIQRFQVQAEAERLRALCLHAYALALATYTTQVINIDTYNHTFEWQTIKERLAPGVEFGIQAQVLGPPSRPTEPLTTACTFSDNSIYFYPDAHTSAGSIYLTDSAKSCLYAVTLPVGAISYLRVYSYKSNRWHLIE